MPFELVPHGTRIDFIGKRHLCAILSVALIVAGMVAVAVRGVHWGTDFEGGSEIQVQFEANVPADEGKVRSTIAGFPGIVDPTVVRFGAVEGNEFLIKFKGNVEETAPEEGARSNDMVVNLVNLLAGQIGPLHLQRVDFVGPRVGAELRRDGVSALVLASLAILIYIAIRFSSRFAPGAIVAVIHDLLVTAGILVILGKEFDLRILAAMLAILGYSLNDTIIIYDRIRENMELRTSRDLVTVLNESVNQTLSRTVLTSGTTLLALAALWALGGPVIQPFALAMLIGVVVGTYSSVYIAAPTLLLLEDRFGAARVAGRK